MSALTILSVGVTLSLAIVFATLSSDEISYLLYALESGYSRLALKTKLYLEIQRDRAQFSFSKFIRGFRK